MWNRGRELFKLRKVFLAAGTVAMLGALLSGCSSPVLSPTEVPTEKGIAPSQTTSSTATPGPTIFNWEPVSSSCKQLITAQELFDYNANVSFDQQLQVPIDAIPSVFGSVTGIKCVYINQTSKVKTYLVVGKVNPSQASQLSQAMTSGGKTLTNAPRGISATWTDNAVGGTLCIQKSNYLIVSTSDYYSTSSDAFEFISPVLDRLS